MQQTLFQMRDLELVLTDQPAPAAVELLEETVWGTPGGANYRHLTTRDKVTNLKNGFWMTLRKGDKVFGTFAFCGRKGITGGKAYPSWYIRYFSMADFLRIKEQPSGAKKRKSRPNPVRTVVQDFLAEPEGLQYPGLQNDQSIFYAFVELTNDRSQQMCASMGFSPLRKFSTNTFTRVFPKSDPRVGEIKEAEIPQLLAETREFYKDYSFFHDDHLQAPGDYFVLRENGKILAAVKAHRATWIVSHLPGFSGKIIVNAVPYIPLLNRVFNPKKFRFLAFEGIWYANGREDLLNKLFESVLEQTGYYAALIWLDTDSPLQETLRKSCRLGLMDKLQEDVPADVIVRYHNVPEEEQKKFASNPVYISGFDAT